MRGTNEKNGKPLAGLEHLRQSVADILRTPVGSRVLRREYGSRLFSLVDAPVNLSWRMDVISATAEALDRWEPRLRVQSVSIAVPAPGQVVISLVAVYLPNGEEIKIEGIEI